MLERRGSDLSGDRQPLAVGRAFVTRPRLLLPDPSTEDTRRPIVQDIGGPVRYLRAQQERTIVLDQPSFDFALAPGDAFAVLERGEGSLAGGTEELAPDTRCGPLAP